MSEEVTKISIKEYYNLSIRLILFFEKPFRNAYTRIGISQMTILTAVIQNFQKSKKNNFLIYNLRVHFDAGRK